jgi:hypothetical protein
MNSNDQLRLQRLLAERLEPVTRRVRRARLLRAWAPLAAGTALLGVALRLLEERRGWQLGAGWPLLALVALALGLWIWRRGGVAADDARKTARAIEASDPELRALLLTAVAQSEAPAAGLSYLQEQVIVAAVDRAEVAAWQGVVSPRKLRALTAATGGAALVAGICVVTGLFPDLTAWFADDYGLRVSPGNTTIERGATLVVLARFSRHAPGGAELVVRRPGQAPLRLTMRRNLEDPVWGGVVPGLGGDAEYFVEHDGGRSPRYRIKVFEAPDVERLDARIEYPQQPAQGVRDVADARFISVLEGARVTITARLRGPAKQVQLIAQAAGAGAGGDAAISMSPVGKPVRQVWQAVLTPTTSGRYEVRVSDDDGRHNEVPPRLSLDLHKNQPPELRLSFPGRDVRVSPVEEMTVEAKLSDDSALEGYGVSYQLTGRPARELRLGGPGKPPTTQVTARAVIDLEGLGAHPAELVTYHFWAEDRDGAGRVRRTSSDMYFAEVRPFEEPGRRGPAAKSHHQRHLATGTSGARRSARRRDRPGHRGAGQGASGAGRGNRRRARQKPRWPRTGGARRGGECDDGRQR